MTPKRPVKRAVRTHTPARVLSDLRGLAYTPLLAPEGPPPDFLFRTGGTAHYWSAAARRDEARQRVAQMEQAARDILGRPTHAHMREYLRNHATKTALYDPTVVDYVRAHIPHFNIDQADVTRQLSNPVSPRWALSYHYLSQPFAQWHWRTQGMVAEFSLQSDTFQTRGRVEHTLTVKLQPDGPSSPALDHLFSSYLPPLTWSSRFRGFFQVARQPLLRLDGVAVSFARKFDLAHSRSAWLDLLRQADAALGGDLAMQCLLRSALRRKDALDAVKFARTIHGGVELSRAASV